MSTLKIEHISHLDNGTPDLSIDSSGHLNIVNGNLQMGGVTMLDTNVGAPLPLAGGTLTGHVNGTTFGTNLPTPVSIGGTPADLNTAEVGPGYINLARDDTADAAQIRFAKNGSLHSYIETSTNGLRFITNVGDISLQGGNVGIGTASPASELDVKGDFRITRNVAAGHASEGNWNFYISMEDAARYGSLYINPSVSTGELSIMNNKFRIKNNGNVGIGVTSPDAKLHVYSSSGNTYAKLESNANNTRSALLPYAKKSDGSAITGFIGVVGDANKMEVATTTNDPIHFYTNNSPTNSGIFLKADGNVGIGTTNPTGKLHVYDSGTMDINLVGNPPELNLEDTSSSSGAKRARLTVDTGFIYIQGLSDDDQSINHTFLRGDLSNGDLYLENVNGHQLSHRNLINNGGMQIAQRNASYTITTSGYQYNCLDRWGNYYAGTTVGQQEQIVFNQLKKVMRITATTSVSNLYTFQWIENGGKILCNGERFSISFKARSSVASGKTCTVQMRYGNAGAGNTAQSDTIGSATLTNSFQQFRFENIDASSFNYTQAGLWLWMPGPSLGDYVEITDVQIELGRNATQFEQKSIAQEMNDCMRFYQRLQGNRDGSGGAAGDRGVFHMHNWGTTNWYGIHHFNVPMRTGPILKTGHDGTYLGSWFSGGNIGDATSIQIQNSNPWRAEISGNHNSSFLQGGSCWLRLDSDNDYIAFDAEHL